jgi:hypothetical protein
MTLLVKARRAGVLAPLGDVADVDVPQVDQRIGHFDELHAVDFHLHRGRPVQRIDRKASGDGAVAAHGLAHLLERLEPEAGAIFQRAAVLVGALVVIRREKLQRQVGVRTVHVDDVEAGIARTQRRVDVILLDHRDVGQVHFLAIRQRFELRGVLARPARRRARFHARGVRAAVPHLYAGQRAELVDMVGHGAQVANVALVPDASRKAVGVVGFRMDRAVLGIDAGPAAFGLDRPVRRLETRAVGAGAVAMRHLVEAVAQRLRTDLDRLEQNVVFGVACHSESPSSEVPCGEMRRCCLVLLVSCSRLAVTLQFS